MKIIKVILALLPVILVLSCKKYLDVKPKGVLIAEKIGDYEGVLNNATMLNPFGFNNTIIIPTDDLTDVTLSPQVQTSVRGNLYFWREYINNATDRPVVWAEMYNYIANLNLITEEVLSAKDGTEEKRKQLYAEALVAKALVYFHLLTFFSPAYDESTAESEYGVPYVISTNQSTPTPPRPSLKESFTTLINDLVKAIPDLPETNINNMRPTKNAAYGMLSRIYLYTGDYENALASADMVLNSGNAVILNYNDYVGIGLPQSNNSPEEILLRHNNNPQLRFSDDLISKFDVDKDLRISFFAQQNQAGFYMYGGVSPIPNKGITYAEIYLNKAECLARTGDIEGALSIVNNDIRKNRFAPADFTELTATTEEEAINMVLAERRRELAFKGTRLSDMKRLDKEGRMNPVKRIAADGTSVLETLEPGSVNYTFQIPLLVQAFNGDMPLNER